MIDYVDTDLQVLELLDAAEHGAVIVGGQCARIAYMRQLACGISEKMRSCARFVHGSWRRRKRGGLASRFPNHEKWFNFRREEAAWLERGRDISCGEACIGC